MAIGKMGDMSPLVVALRVVETEGLRIHIHLSRRPGWLDRKPPFTALAWGKRFGLDFSRGDSVLIYVNERTRRFSILYGPDWQKMTSPRYWPEFAEALRIDLLSTHWERALAIAVRTLGATYSSTRGRGVHSGIGNATPG
jgi:hypothetical protein